MAHGDVVTFTNNTVWGGINAAAWIESFTFQVQSSAVPAPVAASSAAALLALAGPFGRRRRR
jgi:MYXO-CTERM domain-containing protein